MLNIAVVFLAVAVAAISVNQIILNLKAEELQLQLRQLRRRLKQKQRGSDEIMIAVNIRKDGIKVSGHANYAEGGKDIVCAGATALVQTLIKSIEDLTEDKIKYDISPGRADIKYGNLSEKAKTLRDSFFIGICMIADEFPENIRIV